MWQITAPEPLACAGCEHPIAGGQLILSDAPVVNQDSWQTFDLQFGIEAENWAVSLFVDNLTDEKAQLFFNNRFAQQRLSVNQPRTIGINFRFLRGN